MRLIVGAAALLLSACGTRHAPPPQPILTPVEVAVPIATGCIPGNLAAPPVYPDSDTALRSAADAADRYRLLYAGRKLRAARLAELEPVVSGCPKAATP